MLPAAPASAAADGLRCRRCCRDCVMMDWQASCTAACASGLPVDLAAVIAEDTDFACGGSSSRWVDDRNKTRVSCKHLKQQAMSWDTSQCYRNHHVLARTQTLQSKARQSHEHTGITHTARQRWRPQRNPLNFVLMRGCCVQQPSECVTKGVTSAATTTLSTALASTHNTTCTCPAALTRSQTTQPAVDKQED